MKKTMLACLASCAFLAHSVCAQTVYYVATNGNNVAPYTNSWADAATNIQAAAALSANGDTVLVSNGVYVTGAELVLTNNVTLTGVNGPLVTTIARNGAAGNFRVVRLAGTGAQIVGVTISNGLSAAVGGGVSMVVGTKMSNCVVRNCALTAALDGSAVYSSGGAIANCTFTNCAEGTAKSAVLLTGGATIDNSVIANCYFGNGYGALYLNGSGNVARRCRIFGNSKGTFGYACGAQVEAGSSLINSLIYGNQAVANGVGVYMTGGNLLNCTIAGNILTAAGPGGVYRTGGVVTNCIMFGNTGAGIARNYEGDISAVWYSCAPELTPGVHGNLAADPSFINAANADYRLAIGSACLDSGTNLANVTEDIDRRTRPLAAYAGSVARNDMGAYEKDGASGSLEVGFSGSPVLGFNSVQCVFNARVAGTNTNIAWYGWDFTNGGFYNPAFVNLGVVTNTYGLGRFSVSLRVTNSVGETAASTNLNYILVVSSNVYVSTNGGGVVPYASWSSAATNILDAVAVALPGCSVWVSNGVYVTSSELAVPANITLTGVNGPLVTRISRNGSAGNFRVVRLASAGAGIAGVTISNGVTTWAAGGGGGVLMAAGTTMSNCIVRDCTLVGASPQHGGAVASSGGAVVDCTITNCSTDYGANSAVYLTGGATIDNSIIANCSFSAGNGAIYLYGSGNVARRCRIFGNTKGAYGFTSGAQVEAGSSLINCLIYGNKGGNNGGTVYLTGGNLLNCTIVSNSVTGTALAGGVYQTGGTVSNCIIYYNTTNGLPKDYVGDIGAAKNSCAPELTNSANKNLTSDPLFVAAATGNFRLKAGSPCINTGTNQSWMFPPSVTAIDLDGNKRVFHDVVDMGAYEFVFQGTIFAIR